MSEIRDAALALQEEAVAFLRELIRIPSPSGQEREVVGAIQSRMRALGFEEVRVDPFGNVLGRLGSGPRVLAFDAHVDTVGVGDPRLWKVNPFAAELQDGIVYGRGASDQKAGMAALVYAGKLIGDLGLADGCTIWIVGSVLEEDCDGLCWHYLLSEGILRPDLVVLTEPTGLQVHRGQRGRMEIEITTRGVSCHGAVPEKGVNAIYRMVPILREIQRLPDRLAADPFLGRGSITVSQIRSAAPSLCAVADSCTIHLDRRLTAGETDQIAMAEIGWIVGQSPHDAEINIPEFTGPSYTGKVYPMRQYYPAWVLPESHPYVGMALAARERILGEKGDAGHWLFSTNGVATMGMHGIPTIGFGPAFEEFAHSADDQCPADHLGPAIGFYAELTRLFAGPGATKAER